MKSLQKLFLLSSILFAIAAPSRAQTNISNCPSTITGTAAYAVVGSLNPSSNVPCFEITGLAATDTVSVNCGGYDVHGYGGQTDVVYIHDNDPSAYVTFVNCYFYPKSGTSYTASDIALFHIKNSEGAYLSSDYYHGVSIRGENADHTYAISQYVYDGQIKFEDSSDYVELWYSLVDNTATTVYVYGAGQSNANIRFMDSNYWVVVGNASWGSTQTTTLPLRGNTDDDFEFFCQTSHSGACIPGLVYQNAAYNAWDCNYEYAGKWDTTGASYTGYISPTFSGNYGYDADTATVCGYGSVSNASGTQTVATALKGITFSSNFGYGSNSATITTNPRLFYFLGQGSSVSTSNYLTDLYFNSNAGNDYMLDSVFGNSSNTAQKYNSISNVHLYNNAFGTNSYIGGTPKVSIVLNDNSANFVDDGYNLCLGTTPNPSNVTCH